MILNMEAIMIKQIFNKLFLKLCLIGLLSPVFAESQWVFYVENHVNEELNIEYSVKAFGQIYRSYIKVPAYDGYAYMYRIKDNNLHITSINITAATLASGKKVTLQGPTDIEKSYDGKQGPTFLVGDSHILTRHNFVR